MRRGSIGVCALAAALTLGGCSGKKTSPASTGGTDKTTADVAPAAPERTAEAPAVAPASAAGDPKKNMLRLTLKSTPPGATAAVDGREVGKTPMVYEVQADGQVHEFTFVLPGYSMERYRFPPVRDGVIHATMRPIDQADAAPK